VLVTASAADVERMRELGATEMFDYRGGDLAAQVKERHPEGIDGLIDLVSDAPTFASLARLVRKGGHVLTTIDSADEKALHAQGIQGGNFHLHASPVLLQTLAIAVEIGRLRVPVESVIALEEAPAAIARNRAGHSHGKTVIRI
jgi:NADPH:quinone reductase-like Zn-dependent oxidoreductase